MDVHVPPDNPLIERNKMVISQESHVENYSIHVKSKNIYSSEIFKKIKVTPPLLVLYVFM